MFQPSPEKIHTHIPTSNIPIQPFAHFRMFPFAKKMIERLRLKWCELAKKTFTICAETVTVCNLVHYSGAVADLFGHLRFSFKRHTILQSYNPTYARTAHSLKSQKVASAEMVGEKHWQQLKACKRPDNSRTIVWWGKTFLSSKTVARAPLLLVKASVKPLFTHRGTRR